MSAENVATTTVGATIARLRKERNLTQAALAQQAGISASAIAMYETGRRTPDRVAVKKLAAALHVRMSMLLDGQDTAPVVTESAKEAQPASDTKVAVTKQAPPTPKATVKVDTAPMPKVDTAAVPQAVVSHEQSNLTQLTLTREEARIILFLRMNPDAMPFFQSYIAASSRRREQLERTWRLIHEFQPTRDAE